MKRYIYILICLVVIVESKTEKACANNNYVIECVENEQNPLSINNSQSTVYNYSYIDLGLSVKWATCNVGAKSPEEYGNYYAWGEIEEKKFFRIDTYKYWEGVYGETKPEDGYLNIGNEISGTVYDAAYVNMGKSWRMPTQKEAQELVEKCTFEKYTLNGIDGYLFTGPNHNSMFLPFAGYKWGYNINQTSGSKSPMGCYWTGTVHSPYHLVWAYNLATSPNGVRADRFTRRCEGYPIRPVVDMRDSSQPKFETLVLWHANGKTTEISLSKKPQIQFAPDKVLVKGAGINFEYPLSDIVKFTYKKEDIINDIDNPTNQADFTRDNERIVFTGIKSTDEVALYKLNGSRVDIQLKAVDDSLVLPLNSVPQGIYLLRINSQTFKIIKK